MAARDKGAISIFVDLLLTPFTISWGSSPRKSVHFWRSESPICLEGSLDDLSALPCQTDGRPFRESWSNARKIRAAYRVPNFAQLRTYCRPFATLQPARQDRDDLNNWTISNFCKLHNVFNYNLDGTRCPDNNAVFLILIHLCNQWGNQECDKFPFFSLILNAVYGLQICTFSLCIVFWAEGVSYRAAVFLVAIKQVMMWYENWIKLA